MKREDILAMKPGRELDALVAEKVYGWRRITGPKTDYDGPCEYGDVLIPPTVISEDEAFRMMPPKGSIPFHYFVNRNWSTNISAAIEAAEKMGTWQLTKMGIATPTRQYRAIVKANKNIIYAEFSAEALSKAALLAVMDNDS